jgi:hypothetical protein
MHAATHDFPHTEAAPAPAGGTRRRRRRSAHSGWWPLSHAVESFHCLDCRGTIRFEAQQRGQVIRCARCEGLMQAPDPQRGLSARQLRYDVASLLQPQETWHTSRVGQTYARRMHRVAAVVTVIGLGAVMWMWQQMQAPVAAQTMVLAKPATEAEQAERLVARFAAATTDEARATCLRRGPNVTEDVRAYYQAHPQACIDPSAPISAGGVTFYRTDAHSPRVTPVVAQDYAGQAVRLLIEHTPEGPRIEWHASVAARSTSFDWGRGQPAHAAPIAENVRVVAQMDDYWNYAYTDPNLFICLRLNPPTESAGAVEMPTELPIYGYLPATQDNMAALSQAMGASPGPNARLIVDLKASENPAHRQVEISRIVSQGWRLTQR